MEYGYAALCSQLDKLRCENSELRMMLDIARRNYDLQSVLISTQRTVDETENKERRMTLHWQDTLEEGQITTDLPSLSLKSSGPMTMQSLGTDSSPKKIPKEPFSYSAQLSKEGRVPSDSKKQEVLLGEVAFQLERRILFHVFPGQSRLYGFTVLNIPEKILQVSKNPLTGKVDEDYHVQLSKRYRALMDRLYMLGYSAPIHGPFAESVINTYSIFKQRPDGSSAHEWGYFDPEYLRSIIIKISPPRDCLKNCPNSEPASAFQEVFSGTAGC
ncbi:hypothetical protein GJAV_G00016570 [Gymnothorax javanicus]|nr:hypothetical protein GJAV_G00016570 [Gymnothorax javanicus]